MTRTQGPWTLIKGSYIDNIYGANNALVVSLETGTDDAALIAAAPSLLAALEQIIEEFNPKRPDWHLMVSSEGQRMARAAIAKARGDD